MHPCRKRERGRDWRKEGEIEVEEKKKEKITGGRFAAHRLREKNLDLVGLISTSLTLIQPAEFSIDIAK